jgi:hypothetical protein
MPATTGTMSEEHKSALPGQETPAPPEEVLAGEFGPCPRSETGAGWNKAHDQQAIADAQAAVDDWTEAGCGFRLSSGTGSSGDAATTTTTSPSVTSGR